MTYKVRIMANGLYAIYECSAWRETLVKTFKTEKAAKNWIGKRS